MTQTRLVVVDMQRAFRDAGQWQVPRYGEIVPVINQLQENIGPTTVFTRFVRDPQETGGWSAYYRRWDQMRFPPESGAWDITMDVPSTATVVDAPTFSKWGSELADLVPVGSEMVLTGVATDCCVLSTALGAVDAGRFVTVISDACAAVSDEAQEQSFALLRLLSPLCEVLTSEQFFNRGA
ncbi:cysteine hydrolase family protein [Paenarthrobacter sp. AB444]|uniref:cysteine hydrolase family protein n=1 Tax=Paenarthrobacter sp. AB444 TaxID=3025681 RepID=UPI002365E356|nr:cysteine hydrolase [Paenarthrobacter sp. AB444]MDD7833862.1 cysteine hydrolase [Paenarthrobacter sp. AB444]